MRITRGPARPSGVTFTLTGAAPIAWVRYAAFHFDIACQWAAAPLMMTGVFVATWVRRKVRASMLRASSSGMRDGRRSAGGCVRL